MYADALIRNKAAGFDGETKEAGRLETPPTPPKPRFSGWLFIPLSVFALMGRALKGLINYYIEQLLFLPSAFTVCPNVRNETIYTLTSSWGEVRINFCLSVRNSTWEAFNKSCPRYVIRISSPEIANEELRWRMIHRSISALIRSRKLQYIGHTLKKGDRASFWQPFKLR